MIVRSRAVIILPEYVNGIVVSQRCTEFRCEDMCLLGRSKDRDRIEVAFQWSACKTLKRGLPSENARSPGQRRIPASQWPKNRKAQGIGRKTPKTILHLVEDVAAISGEVFIATVAAERDRHLLTCHRRNVVGRDRGGIREGLVEMPSETIHNHSGVRTYNLFVMIGRELPGNHPCIVRFVIPLFLEAYRTSSHWMVHETTHRSNHAGGIHAAAQECPQRNVTHQPNTGSFAEAMADTFTPFFFREGIRLGERKVPIVGFPYLAALRDQIMSRAKFSNCPVDGFGGRNVAK